MRNVCFVPFTSYPSILSLNIYCFFQKVQINPSAKIGNNETKKRAQLNFEPAHFLRETGKGDGKLKGVPLNKLSVENIFHTVMRFEIKKLRKHEKYAAKNAAKCEYFPLNKLKYNDVPIHYYKARTTKFHFDIRKMFHLSLESV